MSAGGGIRSRVLVVWLVLAALIAGIAMLEFRNRSRLPESVAERVPGAEGSRMLLPAAVAELGAVELGHAGMLHRFERDTFGAWFYHGIRYRRRSSKKPSLALDVPAWNVSSGSTCSQATTA
jgi:hypothetical protein